MTRQQAMGREVTMPQSIVHRAVIQCKRCVLKRDTPTMSPEASGSLGSSLETCTLYNARREAIENRHGTHYTAHG